MSVANSKRGGLGRDVAGCRPTVLVHVTTIPMTLGFLAGQVDEMTRRGFEVHAVSSPGDPLDEFGRLHRIEVHAVPMHRRITPMRDLVALARLWRLFRRIRPQIVHAHTPKGGLLGTIAACGAGVSVRIYNVHGLPLQTATGLRRILLGLSERVACALASRVLSVSRSVQDALIERGLCLEPKVRVLREGSCGVDARGAFDPEAVGIGARLATRRKLGIADEALVIGFVGRIVREKGVVELVEAWKVLREEFPDLHLLVVGPFEEHDSPPDAVSTLMCRDPRIHLTGRVSETAPLFAAMDVLALPSYREGFGQVILEAASMRLPVVATRVSGCVDAIQEGITGLLVPPRDAGALAGALRAYLGAPELRLSHGRAGRIRAVRDFSREVLNEATYQESMLWLRERGLSIPTAALENDAEEDGS